MRRRLLSSFLVVTAAFAASAAAADAPAGVAADAPAVVAADAVGNGLRCDGTDPFFFEELEAAGALGYGETWDHTICDDGLAVYGEGANSRWPAFRQPRRPYKKNPEDQMLALVMPLVAVGGLAAVFLAAAGVAAAGRLKKRVVLEVPCPACSAALPIAVDERDAHQLFCPLCGAACAVDVQGRGKHAKASARLLG